MIHVCCTCVVRLNRQDPGSIAERKWVGDECGSALIGRHTNILKQEGAYASYSWLMYYAQITNEQPKQSAQERCAPAQVYVNCP